MSFPLQSLLHQPINGSYKLQSQACLNNPQPAVQLQTATTPTTITTTITHIHQQQQNEHTMSTLIRQKSDEDVISIDSMAQAAGADQPMVLSKKALHQRDADENLFLRFLELDPPTDTTTNTTTGANNNAAGTQSSNSGRRLSLTGKPIGRTPFTMTKKLTRTAERGFGFSIVWTHPPRVEKIESGLSADRSGILPGDYVIFVDKHNVVTMPEADVLNLIRSQGSTLTLEIFRRSGSGGAVAPALSFTGRSNATTVLMNGKTSRVASAASNYASDELQSTTTTATAAALAAAATITPFRRTAPLPPSVASVAANVRPSTACSGGTSSSIEAAKRRLNLPQVTFSKESIVPVTDNRRRFLLQLISREQNFISTLHFGMQRYVQALQDRKDLISPNDHRTLFQNIDELLRISEDILEQLCSDDQEPQMNFASRVYLSKTTAICAAYKKYCNGIKRADCVLVNKSRQTGSEFVTFITEPHVPRKRPDLTMFIHRPLQHFREILKLMQMLASNCHVDTEEYKNFSSVINELQAAYREITVSSGLMEPLGEGRPLLTLQDLESRMVFTKCKPFTLAVQGRQWIFGGDLSRVEGRSVKPYWTLLFSDIIVFAKVSRDRVLFITEEPIPIANVVDSCFHMRKKTTEFRLTVDPNGRLAESPTGYCAPDLARTPKKGARRKSLVLRAPSLELKAVWQNLLQRQIFLVNAALGSTPLSSPLDSPDVLNTLVPLSDIGVATTSIGSIKLSSMDSINLKNQQQRLSNASDQIDMLIDEKCRILNKTGTSKSNAIHLANWMKGQLDKQQEQARLAAERHRDHISQEDEHLLYPESDHDERITYWTRQQLEKRTIELNLAKQNGDLRGKRLSGVEELSVSDGYSENVSQISKSHSTTSDSQITVRSSPIVLDKLAVCRHCHKNCQQSGNSSQQQHHLRPSSTSPTKTAALLCNSLKVQHSQSSPNRCCKVNGNISRTGSTSSISSSTITGEQPSEHSSKILASSSKPETGDTESDVAQLITDELSQSEATDVSVGAIPTSSSSGIDEIQRRITDSISKLRILDEDNETEKLNNKEIIMNGHCSSSSGGENDDKFMDKHRNTNAPIHRKVKITTQTVEETMSNLITTDQKVETTITIAETAKVVKIDSDNETEKSKSTTTTLQKSPKSPKIAKSPHSPKSPGTISRSSQFTPCNCECNPADFENTTLSPDEIQQETCRLIESPKQSPKMPNKHKSLEQITNIVTEDPHKHCRCVCGNRTTYLNEIKKDDDEDDDLSLMLIGLAQFTPAAKLFNMRAMPTAPLPTPTSTNPSDATFLPTIAVVPPTPDAILTKTSTNVWDNSSTNKITSTTANSHIHQIPHQAILENIPDDSCDESPLDEEPPYRPMSSTLRRYGTMSSLEKLPSDDRLDDGELDDLDDDGEEDLDDNARADNVDNIDDDIKIVTKSLYDTENDSVSANGSAWTSRAGSFVTGRMSFFEESRAFIDKYLGRWNQDQTQVQPTSETDEQMDECTSGATSGEEVWGTPTSGGENDDMQLLSSENTHSSPTRSSNSLDDDDTELMMDELLMAPPMSASTIRGLLPRRRLEPLFEEETESDEEKTQQESEELQKGETTTNGHDLEDSAGSSSDEDLANEYEEDYDMDGEEEEPTSMEERIQPHLQTTVLGPRPLQSPHVTQIPPAVLKASSCEYLLEQHSVVALQTSNSCSNNSNLATDMPNNNKPVKVIEETTKTTLTNTTSMTVNQTMLKNQPHSSISTTIKNENVTISKDNTEYTSKTNASITIVRQAKFIPPPPPPRRLLLTQTNLKTSGSDTTKIPPHQQKSGGFADIGSSVDAKGVGNVATGIHSHKTTTTAMTTLPTMTRNTMAACNIKNYITNTAPKEKRLSSTIIETSLLGTLDKQTTSTSSLTVSTMKADRKLVQTEQQVQQQATTMNKAKENQEEKCSDSQVALKHAGSGLSPRLEMRLALNHDILGDEDLISYDPGPDLTTILGHDLSTYHRLTGRDLLHRSATNRIQPKEAVISFSQQRNSKIDTPTVNRRPRPISTGQIGLGGSARVGEAPQPLQPNRNTWSNFASVDQNTDVNERGDVNNKNYNYNRGENKLSDLEILARQEMIYSTSQSRSGSQVKMATMTTKTSTMLTKSKEYLNNPQLMRTTSITSMGGTVNETVDSTNLRVRKIGRDETALMESGKGSKLINFIKRRNSEVPLSPNCSHSSLSESNASTTPIHKQIQMSPRKDNDKPSLNRRLWKQITKRRRANSVSEIAAS
ncbi:uncharacterized protein LOC119669703 [Teleopsis dalmanni]|uniref:uncharacterized protein LOC119669703 n=1 Tax=Teleopsis dalmanni TaxID=139649 RepID=UPI0018CEB0D2|nr:uncharacterized protein LOC119669703 [Teleopsis dalmanni]